MFEGSLPAVAVVFVAIGIIFLAVTLRNFLQAEGKLTPARKTWILIAMIFGAVPIGLFLLHTFSP